MAIDSAAKRKSALYFLGRRKGRLTPDGTISGVDFMDIIGFYNGIAAVASVTLYVVTIDSVSISQPTITVSVTQPTITVSVTQPTISSVTAKNDIS